MRGRSAFLITGLAVASLVADSFRLVRDSTGRNELEGRDFCADLVEFTT
jgi:hypothetical protein